MNLKLANPVLQPISTHTELHFSHLLKEINGMYTVDAEQVAEFEKQLTHAITAAKDTKNPQLINWCGYFDLLVTECRVHVIHVFRTYDLPTVIDADEKCTSCQGEGVVYTLPFQAPDNDLTNCRRCKGTGKKVI